jgi:hypothetical protein
MFPRSPVKQVIEDKNQEHKPSRDPLAALRNALTDALANPVHSCQFEFFKTAPSDPIRLLAIRDVQPILKATDLVDL